MPFVTASTQRGPYDVIIVGSGAGGGQAAYTLCMEGVRVLMLEAGRDTRRPPRRPMFQTPDMAPLGGAGTPDKNKGFYDATVDGGWDVPGEPYVSVPDKWGGALHLVAGADAGRAHQPLGPHLAAQRPYDFKPRSRDGLGLDWPITYDDVAPYYDKVELLIGVYGGETSRGEYAGGTRARLCCRRRSRSSATTSSCIARPSSASRYCPGGEPS